MSAFKLIQSCTRRVQSVLPLFATISLLLYYTFQNEIDMLNSYAETEYLPAIDKAPKGALAPAAALSASNLDPVKADEVGSRSNTIDKDLVRKLSDPLVLKEKNKYFPLLVTNYLKEPFPVHLGTYTKGSSFGHDSNEEPATFFQSGYKEKYPVLYEMSFPSGLDTKKGTLIQAEHFEEDSIDQQDILSKIRHLFLMSWEQEHLTQKAAYDTEASSWPIDLIDSLDSLYLMGQLQEFQEAIDVIADTDFRTPPIAVDFLDIEDITSRALGGLISAYEISGDAELLSKAKDVANVVLHSFDTPNRIPILQYPWKSELRNRFPYRKAEIGKIANTVVELIKLAQLTHTNKYFDAAYRIYGSISASVNEFALDYLFPTSVDSSGCELLSTEEVASGDHLRDSKVMKSINEDLEYILCHQTAKLRPSPNTGSSQKFTMDSTVSSVYSNLAKSYHLLNFYDIIDTNEKGLNKKNHAQDASKNEVVFSQGLEQETEGRIQSSKKIFVSAMEHVGHLMKYTPIIPLERNLTLLSTLNTKSWFGSSTNELRVEMTKYADMKHETCALGATLAMGSKVYNVTAYSEFATQLTESCFELFQLFDGMMPSNVVLDECFNEKCTFNKAAKIDKIVNGAYINKDQFLEDDQTVAAADKVVVTDKKKLSKQKGEDEKLTRVLMFKINDKHGNGVVNLDISDLDSSRDNWLNDPERPLWANKVGEQSILAPHIIESVFYLYRITGESKWRDIGAKMFNMTLQKLRDSNQRAKGIWEIRDLAGIEGSNDYGLPSYWLSKTLKYYYLLFKDHSYYSLDDYTITDGGHIFRRVI